MLEPEYEFLRRFFTDNHNRVAFSDVHLEEMQGCRAKCTRLLTELDALFVRNPGAIHEQYHPICAWDDCDAEQRFSGLFEFLPAYHALNTMLEPVQHLLGGQEDAEIAEIAEDTASKIADLSAQLVEDHLTLEGSSDVRAMFKAALTGTTEQLASLDAAKSRSEVEAQFNAARQGHPMSQMDAIEKVAHIFSKLTTEVRDELKATYPLHFARKRPIASGELAGFAFLLFSLGLTKRKGLYSGDRQLQKFAAQFRDARHIEEASRCDCFITFDKEASKLAASTFAYAGFPTKSVLLEAR